MMWFDYDRQAWVGDDGRYIACGHTTICSCYGKAHEGEVAPLHPTMSYGEADCFSLFNQGYRGARGHARLDENPYYGDRHRWWAMGWHEGAATKGRRINATV